MNSTDLLLTATEPWVVYRTLIDLDGRNEIDPLVTKAKADLLQHPLVQGLIRELQDWPGNVLSSHKSAGQLYHKLAFLADLGLKRDDADFSALTQKMARFVSEEGLFQLPTAISPSHGGSGEELHAWALCDAPLLMYSVVKMNLLADESQNQTRQGVDYLFSLVRGNGWPCKVSKELGKFRGPGRKDDPCPYANLIMLKLSTLFDDQKDSRESRIGVDCLLDLWTTSREQHPYMFYMGTDFRKLKAPFIWYDILHVTDVLSQFEFARKDERFLDMVAVIHAKADGNGQFTPESVWKVWEGWDFGQKKHPSAWLTFLVHRINKRILE